MRLNAGWMIAAAFVAASSLPAKAQTWLATPGTLGTGTVDIGHATLKLPPGDWKQLATMEDVPLQNGGSSLRIANKILAQVADGKLVSLIQLRSNETRSAYGWSADPKCGWRDVLWYDNASEYAKSYDCMMVDYRPMKIRPENILWSEAARQAAAFGGIPQPMLVGEFNMASSSRLDFIKVIVYFDPRYAGITGAPADKYQDSDWYKPSLTPDRQAYVARVQAWAKAYHDAVSDAF